MCCNYNPDISVVSARSKGTFQKPFGSADAANTRIYLQAPAMKVAGSPGCQGALEQRERACCDATRRASCSPTRISEERRAPPSGSAAAVQLREQGCATVGSFSLFHPEGGADQDNLISKTQLLLTPVQSVPLAP